MDEKWYFKTYHRIIVASPVIAILSMISVVFFGYIFTYLTVLMSVENKLSDTDLEDYTFPFAMTSTIESAYSKGASLLIMITIFAGLMLINFFRAVFMDPGYFEDPLNLERKIVLKHANITEESLSKIQFKIFSSNKDKKQKKLTTEEGFYNEEKENDENASIQDFPQSVHTNTEINYYQPQITLRNSEQKYFGSSNKNYSVYSIDDIGQDTENSQSNAVANPNLDEVAKSNKNDNYNSLNNKEKATYKKLKFLCKFNDIASNFPLTHQETMKLRDKISTLLKDNRKIFYDNASSLPDEINNKEFLQKEENKLIEKSKKKDEDETHLENQSISIYSGPNSGSGSNYESMNFKQGGKDKESKVLLLNKITNPEENKEEVDNLKLNSENANSQKSIKTNEIDVFDFFANQDLSKSMLCGTCLRKKIDRSHHCRMCGKCVLKMDHHCPWLANCIGFRNYKYFLLIHFYGIIASLIVTFTYWEAVVNYQFNEDSGIGICWFSSFIYLCNFGLLGFLFWLFIVNWKLVLKNATVIENADKERFPSTKSVNIYDLGIYKNFCNVFGDNPLVWFMPFGANYKGKGLVYETIYKPDIFQIKNK